MDDLIAKVGSDNNVQSSIMCKHGVYVNENWEILVDLCCYDSFPSLNMSKDNQT